MARSILLTVIMVVAIALPAAPTCAQSPREVAEKAMPSVVLVVMEDGDRQPISLGSGFVVREGIIATNHHVIDGATRGHIRPVGQQERFTIEGVVALDEEADLVLLAVNDLRAPALPIGDSDAIGVGDDVYVIGNPQGLEGTFSTGIVSAVRDLDGFRLIQLTAPISPGSSGGPILNTNGEVIGVAVATIKEGQNLNFAIPSAHLFALLQKREDATPLTGKSTTSQLLPGPGPDLPEPEEPDVCIDELLEAAEDGDSEAMYELGIMYEFGLGVHEDHSQAAHWYRSAAEARNDDLFRAIVSETINVHRYREAADAGSVGAMFRLGIMYARGHGVPQDDREAVRWYRKAAETGDAGANLNLGIMYENGRGVVQNYREAMRHYRAAAEAGLARGMHNLGRMYAEGRSLPQDDRAAVHWYMMAAKNGLDGAMLSLGEMYAAGRGVARDYAEAYAWFSVATALGNERARRERNVFASLLPPETRIEAQARSRELFEQVRNRSR